MNIMELYRQTPREEHRNIIVHQGRVYVRTQEGTDEYLLQPDGELQLVSSSKEGVIGDILHELRGIKTKVGI